ncbi:MAG: hypothetical protein AAFX87_05010 [Bacteroidota bacterium]
MSSLRTIRTLGFVYILLIVSQPTEAQKKQTMLAELKKTPLMGKSVPVKFHMIKKGKFKPVKKKDLEVVLAAGTYSNGKILIPNEADYLEDHRIKMRFRSLKNPNYWYDTTIFVDYTGSIVADYRGKPGREGERGNNRAGVFLIGRDGNDGGDGSHGSSGSDGEHIEVNLSAYYDSIMGRELVKAVVKSKSSSKKSTYLVNPAGGKLLITTDGGEGGSGGDGGYGGDGKDAKAPTEKKSAKAPGDGGDGGNGGDGGDGGNGGSITVYVDPTAANYMRLISFSNEGGQAGRSGNSGDGGSGGSSGYGYSSGSSGNKGYSGSRGRKGIAGAQAEIIYQNAVAEQ